MCRKAGIKADRFTAALAKAVRGYEEVPISEIKRRIEAGEFILQGNITDGEVLKRLLSLYGKFTAEGLSCQLYAGDEVCEVQYFKNLLESYKETEEWTEYIMDMEAQEDDEE
ncbi:hypothetical protein [uncultured Ruminococcus sp.]|uniref:hypothetical protein n=1 Tax=uncultured Ruminococcus sp. TaxID=165186 RepID=UPI000EC23B92|nr:hypothetical protein [uncultured Ruminococcus sp.]HCJ42159.1 hypothetical protein [Ruminococcus sp.]